MAKRDIENEVPDDQLSDTDVPTAGERLRAAREEKGLSLEDIAQQTRIPHRHLESIENATWDKLPAPTYTVGFAKSYAATVGLDRAEIGDQLREEMGGQRFASSQAEIIEAADPARTMPKWLVLSAVVAIIVVVLVLTILNNRSLEPAETPVNTAAATSPAPAPAPTQQPPQSAAQGPIVLTAVAPAWIRVTDQGNILYEGVLQPGQRYEVPQTATAPMLRAGAPEALRINVGSAVAPQVGPAGKVTSNVSLKPEDLMRGPEMQGAAAAQSQPGAAPPQQ